MALQINTTLNTQDGGLVSSGAYVIFSTTFPANSLKYIVELIIYRSFSAFNLNLEPIKVTQIKKPFFSKSLTLSEFSSLTPITVHDEVKIFLESHVGVGNVVVVS